MPEKPQYNETLQKLKALSNPKAVEGMKRFGINPNNTYGVSIPNLRKMAKHVGTNHTLAQQLWKSRIHEARIIASMIDDPKMVTEEQFENWVKDIGSWDVHACKRHRILEVSAHNKKRIHRQPKLR